jgi:hypothetical protein
LIIGAPDPESEGHGATAEGGDGAFGRCGVFGKLFGDVEQDGARFFDVRIVTKGEGDGAKHPLIHEREVDIGLAGHRAVGDDNTAVIGSAENGVAEVKALDDGGFDAGRSCDLHVIAESERAIEQKGNACDEVAEGVLGGEAEHDRNNADTGEPRVAEVAKLGHQMRVCQEDEGIDNHPGELTEETNGGRVRSHVEMPGTLEHAFHGEAQYPSDKPGEKKKDDAVREGAEGLGRVEHLPVRKRVHFLKEFDHDRHSDIRIIYRRMAWLKSDEEFGKASGDDEFEAHQKPKDKEKDKKDADNDWRDEGKQQDLVASDFANLDFVVEHAAHGLAARVVSGSDVRLEIMQRVTLTLFLEQGEKLLATAKIIVATQLEAGKVGLVLAVKNGVAIFFEIDSGLAGGCLDLPDIFVELLRGGIGDEIEAAHMAVAQERIGHGGVLEAGKSLLNEAGDLVLEGADGKEANGGDNQKH